MFFGKFFEREKSMIQNIVFVLGAGASCPYGFPTGKELRKEILSDHVDDYDAYLRATGLEEPLIAKPLHRATDFVEKFRKSSNESIDLFLARNPEFSMSGKGAIIFRILAAEHASGFREKTKYENQDWYMWLYKQMTDKLKQKEDYSHFCENKDVSFITFNYDRSLEHFLYDSLANSFIGIPEDKIIEQLNQIEICHVFGQVGPLKWQDENLKWQDEGSGIEYRVDVNKTRIDKLCDNIKIVHEKGENPKLEEAQELISKAHRVFFLGFGYAEENLDALGFPDVFIGDKRVFGTAMGFTKREINSVKSLFPDVVKSFLIIEDLDCLAFLRKYL